MRAARRGKIRKVHIGFHHGNASGIYVYETPYSRARRWGRVPEAPAIVAENMEARRRVAEAAVAEVTAGRLEWEDVDRLVDAAARAHRATELRTREGLAYYAVVGAQARRDERSAQRELELIRAAQRDESRVPALRAAYGRRRR